MITDPLPDLPVDEPAERHVLGSCMLSVPAFDECVRIIRPDMFFRPVHGEIFGTMIRMRAENRPIDPIALADFMGMDTLIRLGGAPFLADLIGAVPTAGNAAYSAEIVRDKHARRSIFGLAQHLAQLVRDGAHHDVLDVVDSARKAIDDLTEGIRGNDGIYTPDDVMPELMAEWKDPIPPGIPTGWSDLDVMLQGGLKPGNLVVVGGRPGQGKSLVACNITRSLSSRGKQVLFFSLEMSRHELLARITADTSNVRLYNLNTHHLNEFDWRRIDEAEHRRQAWCPVRIIDAPNQTLASIRSHSREQARRPGGLHLIVVDYLSLIEATNPRLERHLVISDISRGLKLLAKELGIPVLAVHQLNRKSEDRPNRIPQLADFRESGSVEQDADIGILLWHNPERDDPRQGEIDFILAKQRQGPTGTVTLAWAPEYARIKGFADDRPRNGSTEWHGLHVVSSADGPEEQEEEKPQGFDFKEPDRVD